MNNTNKGKKINVQEISKENLLNGLPIHERERRKQQAKQDLILLAEEEGYEVLSEYTGYKDDIALKHLECGRIYNIKPTAFKDGRRCNCLFEKECKWCGQIFIGDKCKLYCSDKCSNKAMNNKRKAIIRMLIKDNKSEKIDKHLIYKRDKGICGICKQLIDIDFKYPHPLSLSIDHIMPLSKGGWHICSNVQSAHLSCNIVKGDR